MGICIGCDNDIFVKNNDFHCENCGKQTQYKCWNCKETITPEIIIPIYKEEKECSWCGFFICKNCNYCGKKKKQNDFVVCERTELSKLITERFKVNSIKTKISEAVQILGNIKQGKHNRYCVRNLPYTYAKTKNKEYLCLMRGWKTKNDLDKQLFNQRYDEITQESIGKEWSVSSKREDGSHGQEVREACNLAVCLGTVERVKDENGFWKYKRVTKNICQYWNEENIMFKVCTRKGCGNKYLDDTKQTDCICIYIKGNKKGQHPKLKLKISNVSTCKLPGLNFKTQVD